MRRRCYFALHHDQWKKRCTTGRCFLKNMIFSDTTAVTWNFFPVSRTSLSFMNHFANDSVFQCLRLHEPLYFATGRSRRRVSDTWKRLWRPDNGSALQPVLPSWEFDKHPRWPERRMCIPIRSYPMKGFGNGFNNTLYFERRHGLWKLMQFEDLSDWFDCKWRK